MNTATRSETQGATSRAAEYWAEPTGLIRDDFPQSNFRRQARRQTPRARCINPSQDADVEPARGVDQEPPSDRRVVLVPGLRDSGPLHWQTLWHARFPQFVRVRQRDYNAPDLDRWALNIACAVHGTRAAPIVVAHSFGCLAALRAVALGLRVGGLLLVAPADPNRFDVGTMLPSSRLDCPTIMIASTNDPWLKVMQAGHLATTLGARLVVLRQAGHINADSGFGAWPEGLKYVRELDEEAGEFGRIPLGSCRLREQHSAC